MGASSSDSQAQLEVTKGRLAFESGDWTLASKTYKAVLDKINKGQSGQVDLKIKVLKEQARLLSA